MNIQKICFPVKESLFHFSPHEFTERVRLVKALRSASTADAAPETSGLDKAPFYAPVSASIYGKNERKKLGGAQQQQNRLCLA